MNRVDATCQECSSPIVWTTVTLRLCESCLLSRELHQILRPSRALPPRPALTLLGAPASRLRRLLKERPSLKLLA